MAFSSPTISALEAIGNIHYPEPWKSSKTIFLYSMFHPCPLFYVDGASIYIFKTVLDERPTSVKEITVETYDLVTPNLPFPEIKLVNF